MATVGTLTQLLSVVNEKMLERDLMLVGWVECGFSRSFALRWLPCKEDNDQIDVGQ